jgi:hypothetical protein
MSRTLWRRAACALLLMIAIGCDSRGQKVQRVEGVTAIRIFGPSGNGVPIEGADQRARVVAFINRYRSGWHLAEANASPPLVTAVLYGDGKARSVFSAGPSYFATDALSRAASARELEEFWQLVGMFDRLSM